MAQLQRNGPARTDWSRSDDHRSTQPAPRARGDERERNTQKGTKEGEAEDADTAGSKPNASSAAAWKHSSAALGPASWPACCQRRGWSTVCTVTLEHTWIDGECVKIDRECFAQMARWRTRPDGTTRRILRAECSHRASSLHCARCLSAVSESGALAQPTQCCREEWRTAGCNEPPHASPLSSASSVRRPLGVALGTAARDAAPDWRTLAQRPQQTAHCSSSAQIRSVPIAPLMRSASRRPATRHDHCGARKTCMHGPATRTQEGGRSANKHTARGPLLISASSVTHRTESHPHCSEHVGQYERKQGASE